MEQETKICQNCKASFTIDAQDFAYYEKIKVPTPTWCPECRMIRRMIWRNEIFLYKRPDSRTGQIIFSMFSESSPVKVWEERDWMSDILEGLDYGKEYDFSEPFFKQLFDLNNEVPWASRNITELVNSDYSNNSAFLKNCYLVFGTGEAEDCAYSNGSNKIKDVFDSSFLEKAEIAYGSHNSYNCFKIFFSADCENSNNIMFCRDCIGVNDCFGCVGLRNKSYHIFNKPYSKEDYKKYLDNLDFGSYKTLLDIKKQTKELWIKYPVKFMHSHHNSGDCSGDYVYDSKNIKDSFQIINGENIKYCCFLRFGTSKDCYDFYRFSYNSELIYESSNCGHSISKLKFCFSCFHGSHDLSYCIWCFDSSNLFGCIGLKNKQYCIFNKQYTKEQYEEMVPKIIEHMNSMPYVDKKGKEYKYGEFFPPELCPLAYNETVAQDYFPLTKEQALEQGYTWKDSEIRNISIDIKPENLPDHIKDVKDDILGKVIECEHKGQCNEQCTTAFKIIPQELEFYRKMNLPLPRFCPNCRYFQRIKEENPLKLWVRQCAKCGADIKTSYAPDRKEIVYCESCYNKEVN